VFEKREWCKIVSDKDFKSLGIIVKATPVEHGPYPNPDDPTSKRRFTMLDPRYVKAFNKYCKENDLTSVAWAPAVVLDNGTNVYLYERDPNITKDSVLKWCKRLDLDE
jgi:hypothetical protein